MPDREIIFNSRKRLFETNVKKKKKEKKRERFDIILSQLGKRDYQMTVYHEKYSLYSWGKKKEKEKDSKLNRETRKKETFTRDNGMESQYQHER